MRLPWRRVRKSTVSPSDPADQERAPTHTGCSTTRASSPERCPPEAGIGHAASGDATAQPDTANNNTQRDNHADVSNVEPDNVALSPRWSGVSYVCAVRK